MSGKSQTIGDFTVSRLSLILPIFRIICPRFSRDAMFICDRGTGAQQFRGLVMSEIHRRSSRRYKFEFSSVGNDRRPSQESETRRENKNVPDSPDLSPFILDDRGYLRFRVFISRQNLGQSGNSKIPDRLGFSRHMETRLKWEVSDNVDIGEGWVVSFPRNQNWSKKNF